MKFNNKIYTITLSWLVLIVGIHDGHAQKSINERLVIPLSNPGETVNLETNLVNGNITIRPYNGKEVIVEASAITESCCDHDDDKKNSTANGMKKISSSPFDVEASEENNNIEITTNSWQTKINLVISTPKNTNLNIGTINGKIEIGDMEGQMEVSCVNGGISFGKLNGSMISNSVNGDIIGSVTSATPDQPMSFTTLNGNVDISFPSDIKAKIKVKSDRGDIYTDFEMSIEQSQPKVETSSSRYKVSVESWVTGNINGGGPEFIFKNMNGNIYLRKN